MSVHYPLKTQCVRIGCTLFKKEIEPMDLVYILRFISDIMADND